MPGMDDLQAIRRRAFSQFLRGLTVNALRYEAETRFRRVLDAPAGSGKDEDPLLLLVRDELLRRGEERAWKSASGAASYGAPRERV